MQQVKAITAAVLFLFMWVSSAQAGIKIEVAEVQNGVTYIKGNGAVLGAQIYWEGGLVTTANNNNGGFSFFGILPPDCIGVLSDLNETGDVAVLGCTPVAAGVPASVPQTGQRNPYVAGDDGTLQKGVAWPNPRFTDNNDGTITDNLTGLNWLQNANCPGDTRTWFDALDFVAGINNGINDCGDISNAGSYQTDWRLPNVRELQSLVDYGRLNPALPLNHPFTNLQASWYWSSSTFLSSNSSAWTVDFFNGFVSFSAKCCFPRFFVIAVRGGN